MYKFLTIFVLLIVTNVNANDTKLVSNIFNKLDLSTFPSSLAQRIKYSDKKFLKDFYKEPTELTDVKLIISTESWYHKFEILGYQAGNILICHLDDSVEGSYISQSLIIAKKASDGTLMAIKNSDVDHRDCPEKVGLQAFALED